MYITYQMTASVIEATSAMSLLSIRYLTIASGLSIGPAAGYSVVNVYTYMSE